ncbi:MAG: cell division protein SepF [Cellulosilyticaceae bacterium]
MKSFITKIKDALMPEDEFEDEDEIEEEAPKQHEQAPKPRPTMNGGNMMQNKIVPLGMNGKMEILNFTMTTYDMTGEICSYIKAKKPVIVNMQKLDKGEVQRAVDYLTGACYALNGSVERVADNIFIFAPEHIHISPEQIKQKNMWANI